MGGQFTKIKSFEPLTRDKWDSIRKAFTPTQAIVAGLNFVDFRFGAGVIDDQTKCVWTRERRRVTIFVSNGAYGASISKLEDPSCPKQR